MKTIFKIAVLMALTTMATPRALVASEQFKSDAALWPSIYGKDASGRSNFVYNLFKVPVADGLVRSSFISSISMPKIEHFVIPERIKPDVDFWRSIYSEWDTNQVVFYDSKSKFIYDVLNLPKIDNELSTPRFRKTVEQRYKEVVEILTKVSNSIALPPDDVRAAAIYQVLKKHSLLKEKDLVSRLRNQNGLRSQFEYGLKKSGRYADDMQAVLRSQGLPEDLLALVFVESLFYLSATSHAGAAGPWGFVKETAINSGIHVNNFTDERLDPVVSTLAASRYLSKAKQGLTEWPLAITSYNYGYAGMMRAVNNLGSSDFGVIVDNHDSPMFGYASQNYYAEFLAAREIWLNQEKYFPAIKKEDRWQYETVQISRPVEVGDLIASGAIDRDNLTQLNFGLTRRTLTNLEVIPPDYVLRVPKGNANHFYKQVKKIPNAKRESAAHKISTKYMAKGKESLFRIAKFFGVSSEFLSKKMGKAIDYQPKGPVLIRSQAHLFSPLLEINQSMLAALNAAKASGNPSEIRAVESKN